MKALEAVVVATLLATSACQPSPAQTPAPVAPPPAPSTALDAWLVQHPSVAGAIVWESAYGALPWARWDAAARRLLNEAFLAETATLEGRGDPRGFPLQDPPPNLAAGSPNRTILSAGDAFRLYAAYVGHSLALEISGKLPWSIATDPPALLQVLLDGRGMFVFRRDVAMGTSPPNPGGAYEIDSHRSGWAVPAPPAVAMDLLTREHLLGSTRLATIDALVGWARRLRHVRGKIDNDNGEQVWQYRGFAPISRILAGGPDHRHVTAGCWGTTGFFISVLRAANIPVRLANVRPRMAGRGCSHATPFFVSEHRFLSHGDDPYNRHVVSLEESRLSPDQLLIDEATWSAWFGDGADPAATCSNVGRQPLELELTTLSPYLMELYCEDTRSRADRRTGHVAHAFGVDRPETAFPLSRLEQARLWERLAEKARTTGACTRAPIAPVQAPDPGEGAPEGL